MGLVNHVCDPDEVVAAAMACAQRIAKLPPYAVQMTKRLLNIHLERAVLATIDFAAASEYESFATEDVRAFLERMAPSGESGGSTPTGRELT